MTYFLILFEKPLCFLLKRKFTDCIHCFGERKLILLSLIKVIWCLVLFEAASWLPVTYFLILFEKPLCFLLKRKFTDCIHCFGEHKFILLSLISLFYVFSCRGLFML